MFNWEHRKCTSLVIVTGRCTSEESNEECLDVLASVLLILFAFCIRLRCLDFLLSSPPELACLSALRRVFLGDVESKSLIMLFSKLLI